MIILGLTLLLIAVAFWAGTAWGRAIERDLWIDRARRYARGGDA